MDAAVQFVRNLLCCVKDWSLFRDTAPMLYDPKVTQSFYRFPEPLNRTTPLEVVISLSQLYAFASASYSGYRLVASNYGKFQRLQRLVQTRKPDRHNRTRADTVVNTSLVEEATSALKQMFIGFNVFFIGISFFWLFANSWHVTTTDWLGGLQGLIHALTVMEIALIPLLYFMLQDATEHLRTSSYLRSLADEMEAMSSPSKLDTSSMTLKTVQALSDWKPFWAEENVDTSPFSWTSAAAGTDEALAKAEKVEIEKETQNVKIAMEHIAKVAASKWKKGGDDEKEDKILREEMIDDLSVRATAHKWEGYREYLYFALNFVALYGYFLSILVYYYHDEYVDERGGEKVQPPQSDWVRMLKFNLPDADADWHGNFAGDLMWTIEPVVILASPFLVRAASESMRKRKSDAGGKGKDDGKKQTKTTKAKAE